MNIKITEIQEINKKSIITKDILSQLPAWFGIKSEILQYASGVKNKLFIIAEDDFKKAVGFIAVSDLNTFTSEVYLLGVLPEYRGHGIGRKLIEFAWNNNVESNKKYLIVKTLDESTGDKYYEETRKFYEAVGFSPLFSTTKIWDDKNPCLIMIKDR